MQPIKVISKKRGLITILIIAVTIALSWQFLTSTPSGCYSKIFSVGSSLCHQIPSHSFIVGNQQFPICARCSGLYLGSLIGLLYAFRSGRKSGIPKKGYLIMLGFFFVIWGFDGVNSGVSEFLDRPFLYQTTNTTRLLTGYGMGLLMATSLSTLFNMAVWNQKEETPILNKPIQVVLYFLLCGITSLPFIFNNDILFTISAYFTIATAIIIISLLYSVFWIILLKKEGQFSTWKDVSIFLIAGFSSALLQIILLNTLRNSVL